MNPWTPGEVFYAVLATVCATFVGTVLFMLFRSVWGVAFNQVDKEELDKIRRFEADNIKAAKETENKK